MANSNNADLWMYERELQEKSRLMPWNRDSIGSNVQKRIISFLEIEIFKLQQLFRKRKIIFEKLRMKMVFGQMTEMLFCKSFRENSV